MKRPLAILAATIVFVGCTPENLLRPTIPAVPPNGPPPSVQRGETKQGPVTQAQVNEQNARQKAMELEAEMDQDMK